LLPFPTKISKNPKKSEKEIHGKQNCGKNGKLKKLYPIITKKFLHNVLKVKLFPKNRVMTAIEIMDT